MLITIMNIYFILYVDDSIRCHNFVQFFSRIRSDRPFRSRSAPARNAPLKTLRSGFKKAVCSAYFTLLTSIILRHTNFKATSLCCIPNKSVMLLHLHFKYRTYIEYKNKLVFMSCEIAYVLL